jgi:hypothetical protein
MEIESNGVILKFEVELALAHNARHNQQSRFGTFETSSEVMGLHLIYRVYAVKLQHARPGLSQFNVRVDS